MGEALKAKIKQQADFESPAVEAFLNLIVATDAVRAPFESVCAKHEISQSQYNVLRILRGAGKAGHPRCEIAGRMTERAPDITRLVDRLEKQGLVERDRSDEDRRLSVARISRTGLELLDRMEPELTDVKRKISEKMSNAEWIALSSLCEKLYAD
jgi:DNA-binding MarR family transcriptional regulator